MAYYYMMHHVAVFAMWMIPWLVLGLAITVAYVGYVLPDPPATGKEKWIRPHVEVGHCVKCGYDLRASPDYCPECGTPRHRRRDMPAFAWTMHFRVAQEVIDLPVPNDQLAAIEKVSRLAPVAAKAVFGLEHRKVLTGLRAADLWRFVDEVMEAGRAQGISQLLHRSLGRLRNFARKYQHKRVERTG